MTDTETQADWFAPEASTFGDRLAGAREDSGLSQQDLAQQIGVKLSTMKDWEDDLSEPRANRLSMLSGVLNVSLRWLLTGEGEGPSEPTGATMPEGVGALLDELAGLRAEMEATATRMREVEHRLRSTMKGGDA